MENAIIIRIDIIDIVAVVLRAKIGMGRRIINSMSKITNRIAIIKYWFENLKFLFDSELNPHSTLEDML